MQEAPLGGAAAVHRDIKGATVTFAGGGHDTVPMMTLYCASLALVVTIGLFKSLPTV